jgi:hypothetical protein
MLNDVSMKKHEDTTLFLKNWQQLKWLIQIKLSKLLEIIVLVLWLQ